MSTLEVNTIAPLSSSSDVTLGGSSKNIKFASGTTVDFSTNSPTITGITQGITEADQWRLTALIQGVNADITSNLERVDTGGFGLLGSGMTESSGIFSFPSTGIYLIVFHARIEVQSGDLGAIYASATTDNSTYNNTAYIISSDGSGGQGGGSTSSGSFIFDVTNTATHKVKFTTVSLASNSYIAGNTSETATGFTFIRLGDT